MKLFTGETGGPGAPQSSVTAETYGVAEMYGGLRIGRGEVVRTAGAEADQSQDAGADALIVTGAATGAATPLDAVAEVKQVVNLPVLVGSGTNSDTVDQVLKIADGAIVGSSLKEGGNAKNKVSYEATKAFMEKARKARSE